MNRAESRAELEHALAETVSACVDQAPSGPMHVVEACESEAMAVQCLYDLASAACTNVDKRIQYTLTP